MTLSRDTLRGLLRIPAATQATQPLQILSSKQRSGYKQSTVRLAFNAAEIPGLMLVPDGPGPHPAVLYCHAHGNSYGIGCTELIDGRPALQGAYGPTLARMGIASLSIDLAPFGARQRDGPESALSKAALWQGETLMGRMLAELAAALTALENQPQIDATRIATLGLSMGATHAYWLAALHPEIIACAHLCAFSNIAPLINSGAHGLHGPYMTVPGLLDAGDMADVAALIAPRPQLVCAGALDPLTPPDALDPALDRLRMAYAGSTTLDIVISAATGHIETPEMRQAALDFLRRTLRP